MESLRKKIIRLAHENPELRPHLLPLLVRQASSRALIVVVDNGKAVAVEGPFDQRAIKQRIGPAKRKHPGKDIFKLHEGTNPKTDMFLKNVSGIEKLLPSGWKTA